MASELERIRSEIAMLSAAAPSRVAFQSICDALVSSVDADLLLADLERIGDDDSVVGQSYQHDNGFSKVVLALARGCKMRMHCWVTPPLESVISNVHNHRWDFASRILVGSYEHARFAMREDVEARTFNAYRYEPDLTGYRLVDAGVVRLVRLATEQVGEGGQLFLPADCLHRVTVAPEQIVATVVLQGRTVTESTLVCSEHVLLTGGSVRRRQMTARDVQALAIRVRSTLGKRSTGA